MRFPDWTWLIPKKIGKQASLKWLLLGAFVFSLFPVPIGRAKPSETPHPCMYSTCGCSSAEQCWRSCCCNNDEQKLAWAKKHGVTPPAWFVAKMETQSKACTKSCCSKTQSKSCCRKEESVSSSSRRSCCETSSKSKAVSNLKATGKKGMRWIVLDDALRCKGAWLTLDKGIPKQPSDAWVMLDRQQGTPFLALKTCRDSTVGLLPPTPPPRFIGVI